MDEPPPGFVFSEGAKAPHNEAVKRARADSITYGEALDRIAAADASIMDEPPPGFVFSEGPSVDINARCRDLMIDLKCSAGRALDIALREHRRGALSEADAPSIVTVEMALA